MYYIDYMTIIIIIKSYILITLTKSYLNENTFSKNLKINDKLNKIVKIKFKINKTIVFQLNTN